MINTVTPAPGTPLALVEELAASHGWTLARGIETQNPNGHRTYTRDGERIQMSTWPGSGGVPALSAELAAGRVITRQFRREWTGHNVADRDITQAFTGPRAADFPASPYVIAVDAGEFIDRNAYATASNYNTVATVPGRYPVELLDARGEVTADLASARRWFAAIPATIVREYYVNQVLSLSSAHDNAVNRPTVHSLSGDAYVLADGYAPVFLGGLAAIVPAV